MDLCYMRVRDDMNQPQGCVCVCVVLVIGALSSAYSV